MSFKSLTQNPVINARLAYVISGFLFAAATVMVWQWSRQREPVEVSFDSSPQARIPEYATVKNIWLAHSDFASVSRLGQEKFYVAVRSSEAPEVATTGLVVEIHDPELLAAIKTLSDGENDKLTPAALQALATLTAKMRLTGTLSTSALSTANRLALKRALPSLWPGYRVLVEGAKPSLGPALMGFAGALGVFLAAYLLPKNQPAVDEPPVIAPAASPTGHSTAPPPLAPLLAKAPTTASKQEILRELEAVGSGAQDDVVTVGIGMIKLGAPELLPGWLRSFAQANVYVVSTELQNPSAAFIFGPEDDRNYVAVFTRLNLAMQCLREMPQLKYTMKLKGSDLLQLANSGRRGIWVNPLNEACSVKFPAVMMARFIKETAGRG